LQDRVAQAGVIYGLPLECSMSASFDSPYFFASQLRATIQRDLLYGKFTFGYTGSYKEILEVAGHSSGLVFVPIEGIRISVSFPFGTTVLFNEQSIHYDGNHLHCLSKGRRPMALTHDGGLATADLIILPNGTVGKLADGVWSYVTPNGSSFLHKGEKIERVDVRSCILDDPDTNQRAIFRQDGIEYSETGKTRRIIFHGEVCVEQAEDFTSFDCSDFPIIRQTSNGFSLTLEGFNMTFSGTSVGVECKDYSIHMGQDSASFTAEDAEMHFGQSRCEFKTADQVLVADASGLEKMVQVGVEIPAKKKIEITDTHWGPGIPTKPTLTEAQQLEFHRLFVPRFFMVRRDLSGIEYLRSDSLDVTDVTIKTHSIGHPSGNEVELVTYHRIEQPPMACVRFEGQSRAARSNLLKGLNLVKPKKGAEADSELTESAENKQMALMKYANDFAKTIGSQLIGAHEEFLEETTPPPPPDPELLRIPPMTPDPRVLIMQANKGEPKVGENGLDFWSCLESVFAMPEPDVSGTQRPLSPRVALFDPPRTPGGQIERFGDWTPVSRSLPVRTPTVRQISSDNRPTTVKAEPDIINFGSVPKDTPMTASITVTNVGTKPFHFSASQTGDDRLKVLTLPGVVFPGLKMTLKVRLLGTDRDISTCFTLTAKETTGVLSEQKIPVTVHVSDTVSD
jgi:hypothetical protein